MTVLNTKWRKCPCWNVQHSFIHYTHIVEKTPGIALEGLGDSSLPENDEETVKKKFKVTATGLEPRTT